MNHSKKAKNVSNKIKMDQHVAEINPSSPGNIPGVCIYLLVGFTGSLAYGGEIKRLLQNYGSGSK